MRRAVSRFVVLVAFLVVVICFTTSCQPEPAVATTLTKDSFLSPVLFAGEVYVIAPETFDESRNTESLGAFRFKDIEPDWLSQQLMRDYVVGEVGDASFTQIKVRGALIRDYVKASVSEQKELVLDEDSTCLLLEENWLDMTATSLDGKNTGRHVVPDDYAQALEDVFGAVTYDAADFADYDAVYLLVQYDNADLLLNAGTPRFIGCILVIDDTYYYGNTGNEITGDLLASTKEFLTAS